jgi:hypothetical protein
VNQRAGNAAAGAVIGGILGAVIGSAASGGYGGAVAAGAVVGGTAGAAVGSSAAANPNCPPGYVVRAGAPAFYPGPVYGPNVYVAPSWYNPWISYGGHWIYRPYPYHRYWYQHHHW